jgi:plastocyanin
MKPMVPGRIVALFTASLILTAHLPAETHYVAVDDSGFSPSILNINVGDTVVWVNYDDFFPHTTTSDLDVMDPDYWTYYFTDYEEEFQKTFNNPGTFTYSDQVEANLGTIIVNTGSVPEITLLSLRLEGGMFLFEANGLTPGKSHVLETSTNLVQWLPASTNLATAGSFTFTNAANQAAKFFRVVELP